MNIIVLTTYLNGPTVAGGKKLRTSGQRLQSTRTVTCLTNVEAFALKAVDLQEVTSLYSRILRNPRVQGAIRFCIKPHLISPISLIWFSVSAVSILDFT